MKRFSVILGVGAVLLGGLAALRQRPPVETKPRQAVSAPIVSRNALRSVAPRERAERPLPIAGLLPADALPNGDAGWDLEAVRKARREEREARVQEAKFWNDIGLLMEKREHREAVMDRTASL